MDILVRQETSKQKTIYEIYLRLYYKCIKESRAAMRKGEDFYIYKFPLRLEEYPPYDVSTMIHLVMRTLRYSDKLGAEVYLEEHQPYLVVVWTPVQMFHEKRDIYQQLFERCHQALRTYIDSDLYRLSGKKCYYYHVPNVLFGTAPFVPFVAAKFISAVLEKRKFSATPLGLPDGNAGVYVNWEHV